MKRFIFLFLLITANYNFAQKIEKYYDYNWKETVPEKARFFSLLEKTDSGWHCRDYFIHERSLQMDGFYEDADEKIKNGNFHFFHPNGNLMQTGKYVHGKKEGVWLSYHQNGMMSDSAYYSAGNPVGVKLGWYNNGYPSDSSFWNSDGTGIEIRWFDDGTPSSAGRFTEWKNPNGKWQFFHRNGKLSSLETYNNGLLLKKEYYDENGNPADTNNIDRSAVFPGGISAWSKYLGKHLYFPDQYKFVNGDEAVVVVSAAIDEKGMITDVEVTTPFHKDFDRIALDVVKKSPKWIPAVQHNRHVKYRFRQAVTFHQTEY